MNKLYNGLTENEIEERAYPTTYDDDPFTQIYKSHTGFHLPNETIQNLINQDNTQLQLLHINKDIICDLIQSAYHSSQLHQSKSLPLSFNTITYTKHYQTTFIFDARPQLPDTLQKYATPQEITLIFKQERGYQYSLFYNNAFRTSELNSRWNEEFSIVNSSTMLSVTIAGNDIQGVVQFIRHFGYFEGGKGVNKYRVEPSFVLSILSGITTQTTIEVFKEHQSIHVNHLKEKLNALRKRLKLTTNQNEYLLLQTNIQNVSKELESYTTTTQQQIESLMQQTIQYKE
ncbi:Uncharacterized protein QTN25_003027 [Entamoeba marina]